MKQFIINKNDAGQRVDKFITKAVPNLPQSLMYKYIRLKRIKLNRKRTQISDRLCEGDILELYINDEFFDGKTEEKFDFMSCGKKLDIVFEDENILILNKPEGLLCHADKNEYGDTLIGRVKRYMYENGEYNPRQEASFAPALANRIDRNTCGMVLAAKNAEALRILNEKIKNREISKFYLCLVHGRPKPDQALLTGFLKKDEDKNIVKIYDTPQPGGLSIKTKYSVIKTKNNISLLEIELLTGRTHQIRAHLASIGNPLLGEGKYNKNAADKKLGFKHQALCSYKLIFDFNTDAGLLEYLKGKQFEINDIWFVNDF